MQSLHGDRRKAEQHPVFPLTDSNGNKIASERRCGGHDRRKNRLETDVVDKILRLFH